MGAASRRHRGKLLYRTAAALSHDSGRVGKLHKRRFIRVLVQVAGWTGPCLLMCGAYLREELIVVVLQDPHFRLQLPDVVGGGIWRRKDGEGEERLAFQRAQKEKIETQVAAAAGAEGPTWSPKGCCAL